MNHEWAAALADSALACRRPTRRHFLRGSLALAGLGLVAGCGRLPFQAEQPAKVPVIGILPSGGAGSPTAVARLSEAFRRGLGTLGYVEGQNILIEWRDAEIGAGRISEVVVELVGLPVDVLVVSSNDGAQAAKQATDRVPIVCTALVPSAEC